MGFFERVSRWVFPTPFAVDRKVNFVDLVLNLFKFRARFRIKVIFSILFFLYISLFRWDYFQLFPPDAPYRSPYWWVIMFHYTFVSIIPILVAPFLPLLKSTACYFFLYVDQEVFRTLYPIVAVPLLLSSFQRYFKGRNFPPLSSKVYRPESLSFSEIYWFLYTYVYHNNWFERYPTPHAPFILIKSAHDLLLNVIVIDQKLEEDQNYVIFTEREWEITKALPFWLFPGFYLLFLPFWFILRLPFFPLFWLYGLLRFLFNLIVGPVYQFLFRPIYVGFLSFISPPFNFFFQRFFPLLEEQKEAFVESIRSLLAHWSDQLQKAIWAYEEYEEFADSSVYHRWHRDFWRWRAKSKRRRVRYFFTLFLKSLIYYPFWVWFYLSVKLPIFKLVAFFIRVPLFLLRFFLALLVRSLFQFFSLFYIGFFELIIFIRQSLYVERIYLFLYLLYRRIKLPFVDRLLFPYLLSPLLAVIISTRLVRTWYWRTFILPFRRLPKRISYLVNRFFYLLPDRLVSLERGYGVSLIYLAGWFRATFFPLFIIFICSPWGDQFARWVPYKPLYTEAGFIIVSMLLSILLFDFARNWFWWDVRDQQVIVTVAFCCLYTACMAYPLTWIGGVYTKVPIGILKGAFYHLFLPGGGYLLFEVFYPFLELYSVALYSFVLYPLIGFLYLVEFGFNSLFELGSLQFDWQLYLFSLLDWGWYLLLLSFKFLKLYLYYFKLGVVFILSTIWKILIMIDRSELLNHSIPWLFKTIWYTFLFFVDFEVDHSQPKDWWFFDWFLA